MSSSGGFLDELRKRGVVRAGLIYAAAAFALLEFADIAFPRFGIPDSAVSAVLWLGVAGFPVALSAAWMIELRAGRGSGSRTRWLAPSTVATALALVIFGTGMGFWWGGSEGPSEGAAASTDLPDTAKEQREVAIAVLRFTDLDGSDDHAYFAAGLSEEISTALSRFRGIRVIAPSATGHFDHAGAEAGPGASALGIAYLLRGSVRRGPDSVRVAVQLVDAVRGVQIWGEHYDAELAMEALFETEDRIAGRVASALADTSGVLVRSSIATARRRGTDRFEAYDCVLLGQAYLEIHTADVHAPARECLERAVELDPNYADAWAHLAYSYREEYHHGFNELPGSIERAGIAGRRAIELDSANPMAHFAMAQIHFSRSEVDAGVAAMERAYELNPNDTVVLATLATYLIRVGQLEQGIEMARVTAELNPLHPGWLHTSVGLYHYMRGEFDLALDALARTQYRDDIQTLVLQTAAQAQLGLSEVSKTVASLSEADPGFAEAPMGELRRYFLTPETVARVAGGLRKAGLDLD